MNRLFISAYGQVTVGKNVVLNITYSGQMRYKRGDKL